MSKKKRKKGNAASQTNQARKMRHVSNTSQEKLERGFMSPDEDGKEYPVPKERSIAFSFCKTEFERGFQPFSHVLRPLLFQYVQRHIETKCRESDFEVDRSYWEKISSAILDAENAEETLIVASQAGYGKSAFIKAFTLAVIELCLKNPDYAEELSGIVIVLQKVEDLNAMVNCVREHFNDSNAIVALQGWTPSAQREGYCQNADVRDYQECKPRKCPYASECKVRAFHNKAPTAYVVGLTQERFKRYLDTPHMETILNRQNVSGQPRPRRYIFFDENPGLFRISVLTKEKIDTASTEIHHFIQERLLTDNAARIWQKALFYGVDNLYQNLRRSTLGEPKADDLERRGVEIIAGWCQADKKELEERTNHYRYLRDILSKPGRICTPAMKEILTVSERLYSHTPCVYCKSNGFAIFDIKPPQLRFDNHLTVIFDATADIDGDYARMDSVKFLPCPPRQHLERVTFHVYDSPAYSVSKSQMNISWKPAAFARLVHDILDELPLSTFLCTYLAMSRPLYDALKRELAPESLKLLALMPGKEETLPYLGGTNGSNAFNACTQMIMLGNPMLNPETYLTHTCAAYGTETVMDELADYAAAHGDMENAWDLLKLPSVADYANRHTVTRLEQEIYRLAIRNYGNREPIHIHLFAPNPVAFDMLLERFQGVRVERITDVPAYFIEAKATSRAYQGGKTAFAKLAEFLRSHPALPMTISAIRERLSISASAWKELMKDTKVKALSLTN